MNAHVPPQPEDPSGMRPEDFLAKLETVCDAITSEVNRAREVEQDIINAMNIVATAELRLARQFRENVRITIIYGLLTALNAGFFAYFLTRTFW